MEIIKEQHPAYGQISFCRTSGRQKFYGSNIESNHYITMEVRQSELQRTLTDEHYYDYAPIIRIRMTALQYAEMITNMNAIGIPCTIERLNGKKIEDLPNLESRKKFIQDGFKERMKDFADKMETKKEDFERIAKKLNKKDSAEVLETYRFFMQEIKSNIPFFSETFQEFTDKLVVEAKNEIDSAITHKIHQTGLETLFNQQNLLEGTK